ncbi:MAG: DUF1330 domain-containing protein [Chloroflexota bacterium]
MSAIRPNAAAFQQLSASRDEGPVVMLNLLKFKEKADSGDISGRESYNRYGRNVEKLVEELGGRILWHGRAEQLLIGEEDWDAVVLVEYPSRKAFIDMAMSPKMSNIHGDREAGLDRTVLIACRELKGSEA